jgi:hypothetical protein
MPTPALLFAPEDIAAAEVVATVELTLTDQARMLVIADAASSDLAGELLTQIGRRIRETKEAFGPMKAAANQAHKEACDLERRALAPWVESERLVKREVERWDEECQTLRREEERRFREEQRRLDEEARQAAEVERQRLQREEDDRRLAAAEEAARLGDHERADRILGHAKLVQTPVVEPAVARPVAAPPKVPGASVRKTWRHVVTNPSAINRAYLMPNEAKIAALVKSLGPDAVDVVGGIEVYEERQVANRSR